MAGAEGRGPSGGISGLATWTPGVVQAESYRTQPEVGGPGVCLKQVPHLHSSHSVPSSGWAGPGDRGTRLGHESQIQRMSPWSLLSTLATMGVSAGSQGPNWVHCGQTAYSPRILNDQLPSTAVTQMAVCVQQAWGPPVSWGCPEVEGEFCK